MEKCTEQSHVVANCDEIVTIDGVQCVICVCGEMAYYQCLDPTCPC